MSSAEQTSVDSQPFSRQNPSPGNQDISISDASPEVQRRVLEMLSQFSDRDCACSIQIQMSPTNKNAVIPETQDNATTSATNSESSNNTTSNVSGETDVAMQSIGDVEGDVGNLPVNH